MCGRFSGPGDWSEMTEYFDEFVITDSSEPAHEIFPTNNYPVIVAQDGADIRILTARWSLVPSFYSGPLKEWKAATFNARVEEASGKPSFRGSWRRRRCLVPIHHFYEWTGPKNERKKLAIRRRDNHLLVFAGLWDRAATADGEVESFTIVTRAAGLDMAPYHDREPAILEPEQWRKWLEPASGFNLAEATKPETLLISQA